LKTLIINGSPRKNGDTMTIINEMKKYLDGEVEIINTYSDDIHPCVDCRYCWKNNGCAIKDKMQDVYKMLDEVDNVIISSPIYFSELTGQMLNFASRLQRYYSYRYIQKNMDFKLKPKKAAIILAGGGDGNHEPAIKSAKIIFKVINAELIGTVLSLNTNNIPASEDKAALKKAKEVALALNQLYSIKD